jgi:hypothetical protein
MKHSSPDIVREALEKIANGAFGGAATLALEGHWQGFCDELQKIARDALTGDVAQPTRGGSQ